MSATDATDKTIALFESERTVAGLTILAALAVVLVGMSPLGLSAYMVDNADAGGTFDETTEKALGGTGVATGGAVFGSIAGASFCTLTAPACVAGGAMALGAVA